MEDSNNNQSQSENTNNNQSSPHSDPVMDFTKGNNNNTVMGVLSYLGPLVLFPYLMSKDNEFVKFHTKQGLVLFGIEIVAWVIGSMMSFWMLENLLNLATLILTIIGIVNVIQNNKKELPVIGSLANNIKI